MDSIRAQVLSSVRITAVQGGGVSMARPVSVLEGRQLDRRLAPSLAATLAGEPGVTARSNGPMATQPVIRGLTGDRVLVLEDGQRTGDIATTAPDHAVTIDPMTARRVEIIRGPAGLLFGSNSLGGVINVVRDDVPTARSERILAGRMSGQGESVNDGGVAQGQLHGGYGALAWRAGGAWRTAGNTRAPGGALPYSDARGHDIGAGVALLDIGATGGRWRVGGAARDVVSTYGVPSSFGDVVLPGAHDGGVYVDLSRRSGRVDLSWERGAIAPNEKNETIIDARPRFTKVSASSQYVRFAQSELERGGFVGTRFGQLHANTDVLAQYERQGAPIRGTPIRGNVGVWHQWRDFRADGSFTGTRPAVMRAAAVFMMEDWQLDSLVRMMFGAARSVRLQWGARLDRSVITPLDSTPTRLVPDVRTRAFTEVTGAVGLTMELRPGITIGTSVARAFRPPAIEELFSAGPHLATYAYEVGNPELRGERGVGLDVFLRTAHGPWTSELALFAMHMRDFIVQRPLVDSLSGQPITDPRLRRYNVYRADQVNARLHGAEARTRWTSPHVRGLSLEGTWSWVQGTQHTTTGRDALPAMPPIRARMESRWERTAWSATLTADAAARQSRVPRSPVVSSASCALPSQRTVSPTLLPAEYCATPGWVTLQASLGRRWMRGAQLHEIMLSVENALDTEWRDHLWRAKQVAPQPGRNWRAHYRWSW
ncbi:MAG: TonB-dependent receptor [Gemmatimonadaceae bacterium]|nr:TonB-dependent receptor [Gemmatimonadaceae bacterium]